MYNYYTEEVQDVDFSFVSSFSLFLPHFIFFLFFFFLN